MRIIRRGYLVVALLLLGCSAATDVLAEGAVDAAKRSAEKTARQKGPHSADAAKAWENYGNLLGGAGRKREAIAVFEKALAIRMKARRRDDASIASVLNQLGWAVEGVDGDAAAEPYFRRALAARETALGPDHPRTLFSVQRLGSNLFDQSRYADAEPYIRRAAQARSRSLGEADREAALSMRLLGDVVFKLNRIVEAIDTYERALTITEIAFGADSAETAMVLNNLGFANVQINRLTVGIPLLQRALAIRETVLGASGETAITLQNLGTAMFVGGQFDAGADASTRALVMRTRLFGDDSLEVAWSSNQVAVYHQMRGELAQAETLVGRAMTILEARVGANNSDLLFSIEALAMIKEAQGKYSDAFELASKGMDSRVQAFGEEDLQGLRFRETIARTQDYLGQYFESERSYRKVLEIRERLYGPSDVDLCGALTGLADQSFRQQRYQEAEMLYRRTLDIRRHVFGPDHYLVSVSVSRLGRALERQGKYAEAEASYSKNLQMVKATFGEGWFFAVAMEDLADVYDLQGKAAAAVSMYERAIAIREGIFGKSHASVAGSLGRYASLLVKAGRIDDAQAARLRQVSINVAAFGPDHDNSASSYSELAWLQLVRGHIGDSLENYQRATAILIRRGLQLQPATAYAAPISAESEIGRNRMTFLNHVHVAYWAGRQNPAEPGSRADLVAAETTFELTQWAQISDTAAALSQMSLRASSKNELLAVRVRENQDLNREWRAADTSRSAILAKQGDVKQASLLATAQGRLTEIEQRLSRSNEWLRKNFREYAELSIPQALPASETRELLREDEALVLFSLTPWNSFVWVVDRHNTTWVRLDVQPQMLAEMVLAVRRQLVGGRFNLNLAYSVYQSVFGAIEKQLAGKSLLVVADGALASLPLHMLVTERPQPSDESLSERYRHTPWMIRAHTITMLPSVSALKGLRERPARSLAAAPYLGIGNPLLTGQGGDDRRAWTVKKCSETGRAVAAVTVSASLSAEPSTFFRGPTADIGEVRRLEPLPETATELCSVAESFGQGDDAVLLGADASEAQVRRMSREGRLSEYRIVHFATHGVVSGEFQGMAEPSLVLTPPSGLPGDVAASNDGLLTASEIAQLELNADWVVLSACNTAAGSGANADALSGLARAFFYAGTRALLVSHWMVASDAAVKLMTSTFAIMALDRQIGRAEALRKAMIAFIDNGVGDETHPRSWAPFVIVGEGSSR